MKHCLTYYIVTPHTTNLPIPPEKLRNHGSRDGKKKEKKEKKKKEEEIETEDEDEGYDWRSVLGC